MVLEFESLVCIENLQIVRRQAPWFTELPESEPP